MNTLDLYIQDGHTPKRKTAKEFAGPCPSCNGVDRFIIDSNSGRWFCRQCSKYGDNVQYLIEFRGMKFRNACGLLGRTDKLQHNSSVLQPKLKPREEVWVPRKVEIPGAQWQAAAEKFVDLAAQALAADSTAKQYLFSRGLKIATLQAAMLGWNVKTQHVPGELWGLESGRKIKLPAGVVIPCGKPGALNGIKIRVADPKKDEPKYFFVPGSTTKPLIFGSIPIVCVVESELDALLLAQEAGDMVSVAALGSAANKPSVDTFHFFHDSLAIFVSLDSDRAGCIGSSWWLQNFSQALRWPTAFAKDPSEAMQKGLNLRAWLKAAIASTGPNRGILEHAIVKGQHKTSVEQWQPSKAHSIVPASVCVSGEPPVPCRGCWADAYGAHCIKNGVPVPYAVMMPKCEYLQG